MRVIALLLGAAVASGCATGTGASLSAKLVNQGKPARDPGGPPLTSRQIQEHQSVMRELAAGAVMKESLGARAESVDPALAAALRLAGSHPTAGNHLRVAHEYFRLGILDTAHTHATRALLQSPRLAEAHEVLARIWRDWGLPGLGMGPALRATYFDRTSAAAENTLGTLLDALGLPGEAREAFARAVALDAGAGWALNNICFVELRLNRLVDARSHCAAALDVDPGLTAARNNLALTFVASGDAAAARQAFVAAGNPAGAAYNRGIVHLAGGEYTLAAEAFEEAIAARPTFAAAKARAHEARMLAITSFR
ncbi:MAG: tetratricopeptide repeat protein [Luteitalea sp.]|nr:tetratricopeptide repeat protein [Luteitalea sp.]